jgi:hypothetical protein
MQLSESMIRVVGGMLRRQRSCKKKHLRQILSRAVPKLPSIKLRHSGMSQDEGLHRLKDEMTDWSMRVSVIIVNFCKGHKCNISQAMPCAAVSINRWTVPMYCSRWLVFTRTSHPDSHLLSSRRYKCNSILSMFIRDYIIKMSEWFHMIIHVFYMCRMILLFIVYWDDEGTSFMTFVWRSLYPKGNNASKEEGL